MKQIIDVFDKAIARDAYTVELSYEFHKSIAEMSKNTILYKFLNPVTDELKAQRFMLIHEYLNEQEILLEQDAHKMVFKAIKKGDANAARDIMYYHIYNSIKIITEQLESFKNMENHGK